MGELTDADSVTARLPLPVMSSLGVNITLGPDEERLMLSGLHTVEDIFCCCCGQILGWKYVIAHDQTQKYKEGKFVLERWRIVEDVAELFNLDARLGSSDAESP
ncbi:protein yippee-like At5g53940 isoform X2 [Malus sylvestris]|uniref:protein yippee-like At5g53940 isoform X2 n=1 Tax=Malus sylvestris TaxID=3752 RepID=UPI0021AD124E|nr:protein yippee-like At5g53940 isoform X2 [Malus sylvestris]